MGEAFDPCYHKACDDIGNVNLEVFDEMIDAMATVTLQYATSLDGIPPREEAPRSIRHWTMSRNSM